MNYRVKLDVFEGPLDLLLYLIRKEELDICNVSVAQITDQYLEYIHLMQVLDLEVAGEFILMAATIIHIKSKMLLPEEEVEEEEEDFDESLVQQLLEYKKYKEAASSLQRMELEQQDIFNRLPAEAEYDGEGEILLDVSLFDLIGALSRVLENLEGEPVEEIVRDESTVKEKIEFILDMLLKEETVKFSNLFEDIRLKTEAVVTFLALLELVKIQKVKIGKAGRLGEIILHRQNSAQ